MDASELEFILRCGPCLTFCVGTAMRWLVVDALLVGVFYRLTRALLGTLLCDRLEEWWARECRSDRSTLSRVRYASYSLVLASIVLQFFPPYDSPVLFPLHDTPVAFAYHFRDQAALNGTAAPGESVLTRVEVRFGIPTLTAGQHDSVTGAVLASVNTSRADPNMPLALARLLHRSQPDFHFDNLIWAVRTAPFVLSLLLLLLSLVAVAALCRCLQEWELDAVVGLYALCWLLVALPGLLCLILHAHIPQPHFTLTAVGWPPLYLYASAALGSTGWLLALLAWKGKQRAAVLRMGGGDDDIAGLLQTTVV